MIYDFLRIVGLIVPVRNISDYRTALRTGGSVYRYKFIFVLQKCPEGWEPFSLFADKEATK